ncbi:ACR3 family arsenite efflux transporter [Evansella cellulosilytica]|uniref:Arsenical-resistance protein n=1 Tax=Evansella cellulosilytica (strain ATCC 21833 / DSM 2522 / FERM P-1141 / JCM 9156 / N-4) TaxID=649639 RepID=E6TUA0_EVAC2|nr:ACR3 family arsenite efflux transporter [Evansella cellulosilytica]ADU28560.1 arsenical-resistance protein [Evansella cellulosilytica DSM 2522]
MGNEQAQGQGLSFFERYLTIWVAVCIIVGIAIGQLMPAVPNTLDEWKISEISIPVAILIWLMIFPMMAKIDFSSIVNAGKKPKGLVITLVVNWLIKPFTMFFFAWLFFRFIFSPFIPETLATEYIAGAVLLGAAPCTAMVFVWSYLTKGDAGYTLIQVSVNDLILIFAYGPIVALLLRVNNVIVPLDTVFLSVLLFIVIPLAAGYISRVILVKRKGMDWFQNVFLKKAGNFTIIGLLLTLVILFSFQGDVILNNPFHIGLIAVPLIIQTLFIFVIAYLWAKWWRIKHSIAAPAAMIGTSNFFELAVAVAIALFGLNSGAALVTVVGVLVEVPLMLYLVKIANKTKHWFPESSVVKHG